MKKKSMVYLGLIGLVISLLLLTGCGKGGSEPTAAGSNPSNGGVLRYPLLDDPASLDPAKFGDELTVDVGKEIYDGLVDIDFNTNKVVPAHAESWDIKDNKIYTFKLRPGAKFHNGNEVTAEDFKYSFERLLDPAEASVVGWLLDGVKGASDRMAGKVKDTEGIKVVDKYTLEIILDQPSSAFLSRLAHPGAGVVDRKTIEKAKTEGKVFGATGAGADVVIGSGPFKLSRWVPKNTVKIVRFDEYYGRKAYLDGVEFRIIPDETTTLNEFRAGNLDFTDRIPPGQAGIIKTEFPDQVISDKQWRIDFFVINLNTVPFKDNVKLRQALNFAIDREGIIKAVFEGLGVPAGGIIPPGMAEYNEALKGYTFDRDKAKALLSAAGYPAGKGLGAIEIAYANNRETNQKIAEAVQAQLKEIGIDVKLRGLPLPTYQAEVGSGNLSFFKLGWAADALDAGCILSPLFKTGSSENMSNYSDPEVDRLLEAAQIAAHEQERIRLYREAEQKIVDDAPLMLLFHPVSLSLKGKNVQGLGANPMDVLKLSDVWISQ